MGDIWDAVNPSYDMAIALDGEVESHTNQPLKTALSLLHDIDGIALAATSELNISIRKVHDGAPEIAQALTE